MEKSELHIHLSEVSKTYTMGTVKVNALAGVDLEIAPGEFNVILGPSGSGKTTLLNLIGAIDTPTNGNLSILGEELTNLNRKGLAKFRREKIGFIFQFFNLIPTLTARENIEYALQIQKKKSGNEKVDYVLEQVGLTERSNHFPGELSGGEQQRVAIARAIAKEPQIILADEPTGELDYETGIKILELLYSLIESKVTVVMVTHNSEIARIGNRIIKIRSGKIVSNETNSNPVRPSDLRW
jgi:putative ABC transport system ATP-binding protein